MKALFLICHLLVLYGNAVRIIGQYIYYPQVMNWTTAQSYCRKNNGNLATITNDDDHQKAVQATGTSSFLAWIGLRRILPHVNTWYWVDGEESKFTKWNPGEPNDVSPGEECTVINENGWFDTWCWKQFPSLCSRSYMMVKESKTWEEALEYCRTHYTDLVFAYSETQQNLLKIKFGDPQTASVWTDLRFVDGKWFRVNGMPLESLVSLPSCPIQPYRCGAYNFKTSEGENRDCNEELNFLCY